MVWNQVDAVYIAMRVPIAENGKKWPFLPNRGKGTPFVA
jgi:hypothetical protein